MKANHEKSHLLLSTKTQKKKAFGGALVESRSAKKLLGISIDFDLTFDEHISSTCKIINVLNRLGYYMSFDKRRMVMKAFTESQFKYCPLTWMFRSRALKNKINRRHERISELFIPNTSHLFVSFSSNN